MPMIMNEVRAVDQRNLSLGNDKSETLHGSGHGSSVGTIIEPMALHITQDPTVFEGKAPCLTQGNPKTGQATVGVAIPIADKATRYKGGGRFGAPQSKRKSQEGGKNQWQKRIKASVCFLKWDAERR